MSVDEGKLEHDIYCGCAKCVEWKNTVLRGEQAALGLRELERQRDEYREGYARLAARLIDIGADNMMLREKVKTLERAALTAPVPREPQHERWCAKYPRRMDTFRTQEEIDAISKLKCDCAAPAPAKDARPPRKFCFESDGGSRVCDLEQQHNGEHHFVYLMGTAAKDAPTLRERIKAGRTLDQRCALCAKTPVRYVKTRGGFHKICDTCTDVLDASGYILIEPDEIHARDLSADRQETREAPCYPKEEHEKW